MIGHYHYDDDDDDKDDDDNRGEEGNHLTHKEEENLDSISMMVACGRSVAVMSSSYKINNRMRRW